MSCFLWPAGRRESYCDSRWESVASECRSIGMLLFCSRSFSFLLQNFPTLRFDLGWVLVETSNEGALGAESVRFQLLRWNCLVQTAQTKLPRSNLLQMELASDGTSLLDGTALMELALWNWWIWICLQIGIHVQNFSSQNNTLSSGLHRPGNHWARERVREFKFRHELFCAERSSSADDLLFLIWRCAPLLRLVGK